LVPGKESFLALPTGNVLVLGIMPPVEFARLLGAATHSRLHPELQEQVDHAHDTLVWVAARFDDNMKQKLAQAQIQFGLPLLAPDLAKTLAMMQRGKGALMSIDLGEQKLKLCVGATCQNADDAGTMKVSLEKFWNTQARKFLVAGFIIPGVGKLAGEIEQTFAIEARGNTVIASVEANQDTLQELLGALKKNGFVPGVGKLRAPFGQAP
jgi:hypothetical protein